MCGIAGVFDTLRALNPGIDSSVGDSIKAISHRGPDESGFYSDLQCSFGSCRLSIIDLHGGKQPNYDTEKEIYSVFNGEIYNFKELRQTLIEKGYNLLGKGDAECIPFLYKEFGDEFPKLLQGMFAIAIWDKTRKRALLVRDRVGEKPLWYKRIGSAVLFCSELKGLKILEQREGLSEVNKDGIVQYLQYGYVNAPKSIYKDVHQVPPGTSLIFDENNLIPKQYWLRNLESTLDISYGEAVEIGEGLILNAVRDCIVSERPIGSFLSGGVDSSLITALMAKETEQSVSCYTLTFSDKQFDESRFAADVAQNLGIRHRRVPISASPEIVINEIAKFLDQPFADSSVIPFYWLAKYAGKEITVALGGDGGDEVFAGYDRYLAARVLENLNFLLIVSPAPLVSRWASKSRRLRKFLDSATYMSSHNRYFGFHSLIQTRELDEILTVMVDTSLYNVELLKLWNSLSRLTSLRRMQEFDLNTYLPGDLMYKADIASMANSLEVRSPLLNHHVIEFGISLPDKFKINRGKTKRILRDILYRHVPRDLVDRRKKGFAIPQAAWLRQELVPMFESSLFAESSYVQNYFDMRRIRQLFELHRGGKNYDNVLWPIFMLELWAKHWLN